MIGSSSIKPQRFYIAGRYAAGKSTFARRLGALTGIPVYHMDTFIWGPDWTQAKDESVLEAVNRVLAQDSWILEGWIQEEASLQQADVVVFLDPPGWRLALHDIKRYLQGLVRVRPELPKGCRDGFDPIRLRRLMQKDYGEELLGQLAAVPAHKLVRLVSRREQRAYLKQYA